MYQLKLKLKKYVLYIWSLRLHIIKDKGPSNFLPLGWTVVEASFTF
jgi:hypothetical protein